MASVKMIPPAEERRLEAAAKQARISRQERNAQQPLLQLPAELRNHIYSYLIPSSIMIGQYVYEEVPQYTGHPHDRPKGYFEDRNSRFFAATKLPKAFVLCRQIRNEFVPMFFANSTAVLNYDYMGMMKHFGRKVWLNTLSDDSIAALHFLLIVMRSPCSAPRRKMHYLSLMIDRRTEEMDVATAESEWTSEKCKVCLNAYWDNVERLKRALYASNFLKKEHVLRKKDFERMHRKAEMLAWTGKLWHSNKSKLLVWPRKGREDKSVERSI